MNLDLQHQDYDLWLKRKASQMAEHWQSGRTQGFTEGFVTSCLLWLAGVVLWLLVTGRL